MTSEEPGILYAPVIEQRILDRLKYGTVMAVSRQLLESVNVEAVMDRMGDQLLLRLTAEVLGEKIAEDSHTVNWQVPSSWWQHWKLEHRRWLPAWFRCRWPVRWDKHSETIDLTRWRTYPDAKVALPRERFGRPVIYEAVSSIADLPRTGPLIPAASRRPRRLRVPAWYTWVRRQMRRILSGTRGARKS